MQNKTLNIIGKVVFVINWVFFFFIIGTVGSHGFEAFNFETLGRFYFWFWSIPLILSISGFVIASLINSKGGDEVDVYTEDKNPWTGNVRKRTRTYTLVGNLQIASIINLIIGILGFIAPFFFLFLLLK